MNRIYLHDEIKDILVENGNQWMTSKEIARLVNERGRYKQTARAKTPDVSSSQISARTNNYPQMFEKDESKRIRLVKGQTRKF